MNKIAFILIVLLFAMTACGDTSSSDTTAVTITGAAIAAVPDSTATPSPSNTPPPTATPSPTNTPTPTATPEPIIVSEDVTVPHVVNAGETLSTIADSYAVTVDEILVINNLSDANLIDAGQVIQIPQTITKTIIILPEGAPTATPLPPPTEVNGLPVSDIIVLPPDVVANVREIYAAGQALGRNANAFSILGDSTSLNPHFLGRFDNPALYDLGEYAYLQSAIEQFAGSFGRYGVAVRHGLHAWSITDPFWASETWCEANEDVLTCEIRLQNPSILFIRLGSNDAGSPSGFNYNLRQAAQFAIENGVIPVIVTKADRFEGDNSNNEMLRQIAADFAIPLLDFDVVAETLPNRGLKQDDVHMEELVGPHDFTQTAVFQSGHAVHDLVALMMLEAIQQAVQPVNEQQ